MEETRGMDEHIEELASPDAGNKRGDKDKTKTAAISERSGDGRYRHRGRVIQ
jgi:hypothetical protein